MILFYWCGFHWDIKKRTLAIYASDKQAQWRHSISIQYFFFYPNQICDPFLMYDLLYHFVFMLLTYCSADDHFLVNYTREFSFECYLSYCKYLPTWRTNQTQIMCGNVNKICTLDGYLWVRPLLFPFLTDAYFQN